MNTENNTPATIEEIIEIIGDNDDGSFLTGGSPIEEVAAEWDGEGLTAEEVAAYIEAGCFRARSAVALKEAGVDPDEAAKAAPDRIGGYRGTIGYKVANGDISAADAANL